MRTPLLLILFTVNSFLFIPAFAQQGDPKVANDLLSQGNFEVALEEYLLLLEDDSANSTYNYRAAVCYLNSNIDKSKAIPHLQKVLEAGKFDNNTYYLLGRAYHYANKFDDAIRMFGKYTEAGGGTAATEADVNKQIEYCLNAKELMKFPQNVKFENLGPSINTVYPDYYPFVPTDESFIVFNSRRDDGSEKLPNGSFAANVYFSAVTNGEFEKAIQVQKNINTKEGNEEVIGLSAKGDIMLLYYENKISNGNIFIAREVSEKEFGTPVILESSINSRDHEIAATISKDGTTIYFASDRAGGLGGTDIYVSRKLPVGGWGPPQNLGPGVNTEWDEDFPNISPDGQTLYFSSKGHTSMGGYDIFTAAFNPATKNFENVRNLGYPLNTVNDDLNFRASENGRHGYIAAIRPGGAGDYDIYRVTLLDVEPRYTIIKGTVKNSDAAKKITDIFISVTDKKTGEIYGDYLPNFNTMRYVMILPPGEYNVMVDASGFKPISENIKILDKSSFQAEIDKDIVLSPK